MLTKHSPPGAVQFGSQTVTIDPAVSVLINSAPMDSRVADNVIPPGLNTLLPPGVTQAGSCVTIVTGTPCQGGYDTFTIDGVCPLQPSPTEAGTARPPVGDPVINRAAVGTQLEHRTSLSASTALHTQGKLHNSTVTSSHQTVNTATVTKTKPDIVTKEILGPVVRKDVSRVIQFGEPNNPGGKST